MDKLTKHVGGRLKEQRLRKGYSQSDLARMLKVTKAYVSSIESGKRNPSVNVLKRFLDVLEVDVFEFFNRSLNEKFQYSDYQEDYIKNILKNNEKWYSEDSGFWGKRFLEECQETVTAERNRKEVSIILRYIKDKKRKILDAPCGYGRIANQLSKHGFKVTGIDLNQYFIEIAEKEARKKKLDTVFMQGDIFDLRAAGAYDVVLNIFTSIGYFETEDKNEQFLSKLGGFVKLGGMLIIETVNPIGILGDYRPIEKVATKAGGTRMYERFFDIKTSTNIEKSTLYDPDGTIRDKSLHCVRMYYPHELIRICEKSGLKIVDILDSEGKRNNVIGSSRMWLIFEKIR
jgi:2-polyprenyl-3-methyl-5-hydroxy-6-metoxy-1,4-benzoquinol methylase